MKLGRIKPTHAKLKLVKYIGCNLPAAPDAADWTVAMQGQPIGMMGNDTLGDCTVAAMGHAVQIVTSNTTGLITPTDTEIIQMYEDSGYDPNDPSTDQGWLEVPCMQDMCTKGLSGVKMDAFADVDQANHEAIKQAVYLFGGCYIGITITQADMDDFNAGNPWANTSMDNPLGGHAIFIVGYNAMGVCVATWGQWQTATWSWMATHCDEAHACLFFDWVKAQGTDTSPDGFDLQQLTDDLKAL